MSGTEILIWILLVYLSGQQVTATESCQYRYSCTAGGVCTYYTRTCDDICCGDNTKGYYDVCCSSSSKTAVVAGSVCGGSVGFCIFCFIMYYIFRTPPAAPAQENAV